MNINKTINIFVGIDPSLNSTGVAVYIPETEIYNLYNIRSKRTKKEESQMPEYGVIDTVMYKYTDANIYKGNDSHKFELIKTKNIINIVKEIRTILVKHILTSAYNCDYVSLHVCIETNAFSTGIRSVSLIDLCGLNFLIRSMIIKLPEEFACNVNTSLVCASPTEIKKFATNRGDADKDLMLYCFSLLKPEICETYSFMKLDDLADAHFMMLFVYNIYNKENTKDDECINIKHIYTEKQEKMLSDKIKLKSELKKQERMTIKNNKNKKSVWYDSMMQFADNIN